RTATAAIRDDKPDATAASARLYQAIFGAVAPHFRNAPRWILALDGALFDLPVSALIEKQDNVTGTSVYVANHHIVELIPSVAYWVESSSHPRAQLSPLFVGVGDPIYNRADARAAHLAYGPSQSLLLPRLVASGAELEACARAWHGPSVLLRGRDASKEKLAVE